MSTHCDMVKQFHLKHGAPVDVPLTGELDESTDRELSAAADTLTRLAQAFRLMMRERLQRGDGRSLRAHLMLEELGEVLQALAQRDNAGLADGLADLDYVVSGTAVAYDIPHEEVFFEVHQSNMTKKVTGDVRVLDKGVSYNPPTAKIRQILERHWRMKA